MGQKRQICTIWINKQIVRPEKARHAIGADRYRKLAKIWDKKMVNWGPEQ